MAYDGIYFGSNSNQRHVDDLFVMRFTLEHIVLIMDTIYQYREVLQSNDPKLKSLFLLIDTFRQRVVYLEDFTKDSDIKMALKKLGAIDYKALCENWLTIKEEVSHYLPFHSEDGIDPFGLLFDMRDNERSVISEIIKSINLPKKKSRLLFANGFITLNGRIEKLVDSDTIQGVILEMAIKRNGKIVKDFEMQERFEKNTKIMYDELKFNPSKTYSAAVKEINRKARDTLLIDFDLLIYEKKTVRLNDCVVVK